MVGATIPVTAVRGIVALEQIAVDNPIEPIEKLSSSPNPPNELSALHAMTAVLTASAATPDPVLSCHQDRAQTAGEDDPPPESGLISRPFRPRPPRPGNSPNSTASNTLRRKSMGVDTVHVTSSGYRYYGPLTGMWASRGLIEKDGGVNFPCRFLTTYNSDI